MTAYMCLQLVKNYSFPQVFSVHKKSTGRGIVGYILNTSVKFMDDIRERTFDTLLNGYTVDPILSEKLVEFKLLSSELKNLVLIALEPLFNEFFEEVPNALSQNQAAAMDQTGGCICVQATTPTASQFPWLLHGVCACVHACWCARVLASRNCACIEKTLHRHLTELRGRSRDRW